LSQQFFEIKMKTFILISFISFIAIHSVISLKHIEKTRPESVQSDHLTRDKRNVGPANGWHPNPPIDGPIQHNIRSLYCDPEISIGKRDLTSKVDSFPELNDYYMKETNSDIRFIINGTKIPAHKFVLSVKNPKFAQLIQENINDNEIDLDIESIEAFKIILKYFYSEKFQMVNETDYLMAFQVFKLAKSFEIRRLMSLIEESLAKMIFFNNYIEIYKFADSNQLNELMKAWMGFVFTNSNTVIANELFLNESLEITEKILSSLNAEQKYIILSIKKILALNPDLDVKRFTKLIFIERCSVDDLIELKEMQMFDQKLLFEEIVRRYKFLYANCNNRIQLRSYANWN